MLRIAWGIFQQEIPDDTKEGFVSNTVYTVEQSVACYVKLIETFLWVIWAEYT